MELRYVLMDVKKDIGNHMGEAGLTKVPGKQYSADGSLIEEKILKYRLDLVMDDPGSGRQELYEKTEGHDLLR